MSLSWLMLQLSDSAFPTGGFAHSHGLEAAVQLGEAASPGQVKRYIHEWVVQLGHSQLPWVTSAHRSPETLRVLDQGLEAFLTNHVLRRASRVQGQALLATAERVFPSVERLRSGSAGFHHAPLFGAVMRTLELPLEDTQRMFLSLGTRGLCSAAVRLNALGTHEAQVLLAALAVPLERVWESCRALTADDAAQTSPLTDLFAAAHDRLYSKLFLS